MSIPRMTPVSNSVGSVITHHWSASSDVRDEDHPAPDAPKGDTATACGSQEGALPKTQVIRRIGDIEEGFVHRLFYKFDNVRLAVAASSLDCRYQDFRARVLQLPPA